MRHALTILLLLLSWEAFCQPLESIVSEIGTTTGWKNQGRKLYQYDPNGSLASTIGQSWDSASTSWITQSHALYTYNGNGILDQITTLNWDTAAAGWLPKYRVFFTYYSSGLRESHWGETLNNGVWKKESRYVIDYDSAGFKNLRLTQRWSDSLNNWRNSHQYRWTNSSFGSILELFTDRWDPQTSSWTNGSRETYLYNLAGQQIQLLKEQPYSGSWYAYERSFTSYNGSLAISLTQMWDNSVTAWVTNGNYGINTLYDNNGQLLKIENIVQDLATGIWRNLNRTTYNYGLLTAAPEAISSGLQLFPNPTNHLLHVKTSFSGPVHYTIMDISGRILRRLSGTGKEYTINVSELSEGIYLLKATSSAASITRKFQKY